MPIKLKIEFIKKEFEKRNCKLLSTEYLSNKNSLDFICKCNNKDKITYQNLKKGGLCKICSTNNKIEKCKATNIEKYGVEYTSQRTDIKESMSKKLKQPKKFNYEIVKSFFEEQKCTLLDTEYINDRTKMQFICICQNIANQNFNAFKSGNRCNNEECIKNRMKETSLEKYGTEYPMQNEEYAQNIFTKSKKYKKYILPSGKEINIQGYENYTLDSLLQKYNEKDIITDRCDMPEIWYIIRGKYHRYYPDIFIQKDNIIIEVKSNWTYNKNIIIFHNKRKACEYLGYNFESYIYNSKKEKVFMYI
jgi:hypothetical protein